MNKFKSGDIFYKIWKDEKDVYGERYVVKTILDNEVLVCIDRKNKEKYISLEAKISKNKNLYYDALELAGENWHTEQDNPEAFIKYLLGTIISAYRDFEERVDVVADKLPAIDMVKKAISGIIGKFNKSKLIELCPTLSTKSIESALKKLADDNLIEKHGSGKNTFYTVKSK
jgi:Fic family protein